jgi:hypothetical protein
MKKIIQKIPTLYLFLIMIILFSVCISADFIFSQKINIELSLNNATKQKYNNIISYKNEILDVKILPIDIDPIKIDPVEIDPVDKEKYPLGFDLIDTERIHYTDTYLSNGLIKTCMYKNYVVIECSYSVENTSLNLKNKMIERYYNRENYKISDNTIIETSIIYGDVSQ